MSVAWILDHEQDAETDAAVRELLIMCFADQPRFATQRFFDRPPFARVFARDGTRLIGQLAVQCLAMRLGDAYDIVAGIAEVAVHPDCRGRGLVAEMLRVAHREIDSRGWAYSLLFTGKPKVYASAGYAVTRNEVRHFDVAERAWRIDRSGTLMVRTTGTRAWPAEMIDLLGPKF